MPFISLFERLAFASARSQHFTSVSFYIRVRVVVVFAVVDEHFRAFHCTSWLRLGTYLFRTCFLRQTLHLDYDFFLTFGEFLRFHFTSLPWFSFELYRQNFLFLLRHMWLFGLLHFLHFCICRSIVLHLAFFSKLK